MKNRFIILIDFSEYSGNLIKYACSWSKQVNAELLLVHQSMVLAPALTDNYSRQQIVEHTNGQALQKLKALAKEFIPSTIKVSFEVSESNLQLIIAKLLEEPYDNLIFTGIKGTGFLKKIFLGSIALQVIDNIKNCVVAMPKEVDTFSHDNIYVAVTEKHPLNILEFNKFLKFIGKNDTSITFFYLAKPNEKITGIEKHLKELKEMFSNRYNTSFAIYEGSNPLDDIKKVLNIKFDDILVVQKGSRLITDQLFRRFLINELVYEGQTPLIVLP
ncbi:universal stress protein [Arthrospiribacter ruber]|uniref:Universal stress protein n=1 Tax=Arthrospiribacter ruber TaxID=2487934 RepID=A0A951ME67_9BACT|nr:universal stress protein [Arthrospiribacter ruber]MBW3469032.1 universal stress protein [Arthrospiribacter ruber]